MPVIISDNEYEELQILRNYYIREINKSSILSMRKLENDIDLPIKTIVGMFALLGCQPRFSCCGFDYDGQPIHKTHEYGNAYVMLQNNENTKRIINYFLEHKFIIDTIEKTSKWRTWTVDQDNVVFMALAFDWEDSKRNYPWTNKNCIHYAEKGVIGLYYLRKILYTLNELFLDDTIIKDTNSGYKKVGYWQYPILDDWKVNKSELLSIVEKELDL